LLKINFCHVLSEYAFLIAPNFVSNCGVRLNSLAANIYYESIEFTKKFVKTKHFKKWHRVGGQVE